MKSTWTDYIKETRPQYLLMTPICCLVGAAAAYWDSGTINLSYLFIAIIGGVAAHAAVNTLNDYQDYISGLDLLTTTTPFSGGSGLLPAGRLPAKAALIIGLISLGICLVVGVFFLVVSGPGILLVGLPGALLIVLYTNFITRLPILCLLAPGLGFGPCMVLGTYFVLQGYYGLTPAVASLVPLFLVSNLLLLNQFPDAEADRIAGRRHLLVLLSKKKSAKIYAIIATLTYVSVIAAVILNVLPPLTLIALLTLPIAVSTIKGVLKNSENLEALIPLLSKNVLYTLLTPLLLSVGLFIS